MTMVMTWTVMRIIPCRCDSKNCVGYIVRSNLRWRVLRKIQNKKRNN